MLCLEKVGTNLGTNENQNILSNESLNRRVIEYNDGESKELFVLQTYTYIININLDPRQTNTRHYKPKIEKILDTANPKHD